MSANNDKRKSSLYFPDAMWEEIKAEAERQGRPVSRVMQDAWLLSRNRIRKHGDAVEKAYAEMRID